ncbi:MAG: YdhR family protein [Planctomycetota bacterium]
MHVLVVNFNLEGINHDQYSEACDELAGTFAAIPGLIAKVWLSDPDSNTYGGVYTFEDKAAFEAYQAGEVFAAVAGNPNFTNVTAKDFGILDGPTRVTRGVN